MQFSLVQYKNVIIIIILTTIINYNNYNYDNYIRKYM